VNQLLTPDVVILAVLAALLWATATVSVAARSLNRVQRRTWANGGREAALEEGGADAVEDAFISLGLARQTLLVLLVIRLVFTLVTTGWTPAAATAAAVAAFALVDKLLPYWTVALVGPGPALRVLQVLFAVERMLFSWPAAHLRRAARRARRRHREENGDPERGDLGTFLDMAEEEGLVTESEEALLRGVADFEDTIAREVMTPRVDVVAIDSDAVLADLQALIAEHRFSRIPVISADLDHVVGIANLKDLVTALGEGSGDEALTRIVRPAHFVPETKKVSELLSEFQHRHEQLSIVVDEYGGTAGLVTLEDVLEEIVGEIRDEDENEEMLIETREDGIVASGKAEIEDVAAAVGVDVPEGEFHTVGGLVFRELGRVPVRGESFEYGGLQFDILDADERRVHRVSVRQILAEETPE